MEDQELLKALIKEYGVREIPEDTNCWFVRTNSGNYFESFHYGNFISIGWDDLGSIEEIKNSEEEVLKDKVHAKYPEESRPGLIARYIKQFVCTMKENDIVMIPSKNSQYVLFGIIKSDVFEYEPTIEDVIDQGEGADVFIKRRNIEWLDAPKERSALDPYLRSIIYAHNTIVLANDYKSLINRYLYPLYFQDGKLHATFRINRKQDISAKELYEFMGIIFESIDMVSEELGINNDDELIVKTAINSAGPMELITIGAVAFMVLASISMFLCGGRTKTTIKTKLFDFAHENDSDGLFSHFNNRNSDNKKYDLKKRELENRLLKSQEAMQINLEAVDDK